MAFLTLVGGIASAIGFYLLVSKMALDYLIVALAIMLPGFLVVGAKVFLSALRFRFGLDIAQSRKDALESIKSVALLMFLERTSQINDKEAALAIPIAYSLAGSLLWTTIAMFLGHYLRPIDYVPKTGQMVVVNTVCDSLAIMFTHQIFRRILYRRRGFFKYRFSALVALLINFFVASVLACASLFGGLVGSPHSLSVKSTLYTLVGRAADGSHLSFGPNFFLMHTTFIPISVTLFLLFLAYVVKFFIDVLASSFHKLKDEEQPTSLTVAFFAFVSAVTFAVGQIAGALLSLKYAN